MSRRRATVAGGGAAVLAGVAGLHVDWAAGGRRRRDAAVPTSDGRAVMHPAAVPTLLVAGALVSASCRYVGAAARGEPRWIYRLGAAGAASVLAARAVGDRRHVGFFKRSRDPAFARHDTDVYSPLCALLVVAGAVAVA